MKGFIVIDKPAGMTSARVVAQVKRLLPKKTRIGHTGTLDPQVTGLLPLAIGKATKTIAYMNTERKTYRASLTFGLKTDTEDVWGQILETQEPTSFTHQDLNQVLQAFTGRIHQVPPMYSALKKDGQRLYDLARQGKTVEREARPITIYGFSDVVLDFPRLDFTVTCSRGTYIRTLCVDMAKALNNLGTMSALSRLSTGPFTFDQAVKLDDLTADNLKDHLVDLTIMFEDLPVIEVDLKHAGHLCHGVKVNLQRFISKNLPASDLYVVRYKSYFVGLAKAKGQDILLDQLFTDEEELKGVSHARI